MLDWFSWYDTSRTLRLKSAKLGLLWWALTLGALLYALGSIATGGYVVREPLSPLMDVIVKDDKHAQPSCAGLGPGCRVVRALESLCYADRSAVAFALTRKLNHTRHERLESRPMLKLVHSVHSVDFHSGGFHLSGRAMEGELLGADGTVLHASPAGVSDHVALHALLAAAGVDLDSASDVPGEEAEPKRARGLQLQVSIHYSDFDAAAWPPFTGVWPVRPFRYQIRVRHAEGSECKRETLSALGDVASYCVQANFAVTGDRVVFAGWGALLSILSHAAVLMGTATMICDVLAVFVFAERRLVYAQKYLEVEVPSKVTKAD